MVKIDVLNIQICKTLVFHSNLPFRLLENEK